jgi:CHASE2 domain-containing sensor protein
LLLTGTTLQEALAWSYNKKLSDQDYRFLTASQELAKREIEVDLKAEKQARRIEREKSQFALETSRQAYKLLAEARKIAKRKAQTLRLAKNRIISIAGIVASLIILLRIIGLLQGMELTMLDQFFQARPVARIDPRVVIIALDEPDIQQIGQYPVPDQVLVKALQILKSYNPTAIGLDFYRDLPVEPGYKELVEVYKTTPNLIGIEKIVGSAIAPPPVLAQLNQVGFVDQVLDGDGKVRRALLSVQHTNGKLSLSLGLNLALRYLETQGITPKNLPNYKMQIGKAVLIPFLPNDGGFVRADSGGYQILLNFHGIEKQFQIFSITDLLANRIPPNSLRDRIVLIGATAESISDLFQTPYSSRIFDYPHQMAGVTLHANITSHILSAALDGQPVLRVWPEVVEWLWILLWSGVGTLLSWHFQSLRLFTTVTITGVGLTLIAYFAFLQGWWIPHIPPLIGLVVAAVSLPIVITRQLEIIQLRQTVKLLVAAIKEQPTAGQIAIEYLKQAEGQENQLLIEQALQDEI